jgi:hypothetical protein
MAAAQTSPAPRIDGEGINMDARPAPAREPGHPAEGLAPKSDDRQSPKDDRFPADRGDTRPVPNAAPEAST